MPETAGEKVAVSADDLNEVRTSLESSMDTKLNKMESKIDQLTALINKVMDKIKPTKALEDDEDPLLAGAQKAVVDEENDPEKLKNSSSSSKSKNGEEEYSRVPSFISLDPQIPYYQINNIGPPPKINTIDFERWQLEFRSYMCRSCNEL